MLFPHLFKPVQLGTRQLKHRLNFGAHTTNLAEQGLPLDKMLAYYERRAQGGAGVIVIEPVPATLHSRLTNHNFVTDDDTIIAPLATLSEKLHHYDVLALQQIYHVGQHGDYANSYLPSYSVSGLPSFHDNHSSHAMSTAEIEDTIAGFVRAAVRMKKAGLDGCEIFAAYGGLVDQFWSTWSNRRNDDWGGSFENRLTFSKTILERIRQQCGPDFIIGLAVSHEPESGIMPSIDELTRIIAWHDEKKLFDYVTIGSGSYYHTLNIIPPGYSVEKPALEAAVAIKSAIKNGLVQLESHIHTVYAAEEVIRSGQADMVSMVRAQIADPDLAVKALEGRPEAIRPCIGCNQECRGRRNRDYSISCLVNPAVGREKKWLPIKPAKGKKKITVVGAGPAGLEAARLLAQKGHQVQLFEKEPHVGGQFYLAGRQPGRDHINQYLSWLKRQCTQLEVEIFLGTEITDLSSVKTDHLVLAHGSEPLATGFQRALPLLDCLPGLEKPGVFSYWQAMKGLLKPEKKILLLDDLNDFRGIGTALYLQQQGHLVTMITGHSHIAGALNHSGDSAELTRRFVQNGGEIKPSTIIQKWRGDGADIENTMTKTTTNLPANALVVCNNSQPSTGLQEDARRLKMPFSTIGDAVAERNATMAIYEAHTIAMVL